MYRFLAHLRVSGFGYVRPLTLPDLTRCILLLSFSIDGHGASRAGLGRTALYNAYLNAG